MVIAAYAVNAGKEADYEKVIAHVERRAGQVVKAGGQAAACRLEGHQELAANQPDGSSSLHARHLAGVKDADYSITNTRLRGVTDPTAQTDFFNLYKGPCRSRCS